MGIAQISCIWQPWRCCLVTVVTNLRLLIASYKIIAFSKSEYWYKNAWKVINTWNRTWNHPDSFTPSAQAVHQHHVKRRAWHLFKRLQYWQAEKLTSNKGLNISHVNAHAACFQKRILGSPTSASGNPRRIAWEELGHLRESKGFSDSDENREGR